jgi:sigma-B regulation protein RsbU (phosphoserine phosphatase)
MSAGQPGSHAPIEGHLSAGNPLRQVLELGEELLYLAQQAANIHSPVEETLKNQRNLILAAAESALQGEATLWLAEGVVCRLTGKPQGTPVPEDLTGSVSELMRGCLEKRCTCLADSAQSTAFWALDQADGQALTCAAPLLLHDLQAGQLLGALQVQRPKGPPFRAGEVELLEGLAIQAALAFQASLRLATEQWRLQQLSLVQEVSLQIADLRDLDEIARQITRLIQQTFDYYYVAILTLEPGQEFLRFHASAGPVSDKDRSQAYPLDLQVRLGEGIIGYVAQTGEELLANDISQETRYRPLDALPETRSEATLPLRARDRLLGVLDVQSNQVNDFDDTDMLVLRALAGNIAMAADGARLYSALRRRASQLSTVYEVSSAITSILDQEKLLDEVVELIRKHFGYPYVHLYSVHPGRGKIFYEAGSGPRSQILRQQNFVLELDAEQGIIAWVARHAETVLANDVSQEPRYLSSPVEPDETRSELTVPLVFGEEVLGVLDIQSEQVNTFGEDDRFLFEALADHIAIAMRNANLYRSEVWRRRVADSVREVAGLLSAEADLDRVLAAILAELGRSLPLDLAAIWLLDGEDHEDQQEKGSALHLAAVIGAGELDLEIGLTPEDVLEFNRTKISAEASEDASGWLWRALQAEDPVVRNVESAYEPLGAAMQFPADYSAIAAPLRVREQPRGVLVLAHRTPGRYGSEARGMTAAFASYAAVAIENARLFEEAHEQAWVSTVLLQVANATQSLTNLHELLATVVHITPMLAGVRACLLYILDDEGDFVPVVASGLTGAQQAEFERWRFAPGDVPALDHLVAERQPVILYGGEDDQRLTSILYLDLLADHRRQTGLSVLVPLAARDEVLGVLLVDYSGPALNNGKTVDAFFDERLAILQGIAHQTAIAMDNIRLLKSQKEEAYVSVALLQVAQAVVSSNDLDEALGSIVRITPILVGVKRALIFLWDEAQNVFRLSQSYGLPRAAEVSPYGLGEFPLLDAVLIEDTVLAHPLWGEISASDQVPEDWTYLAAPEGDKVDEYLENAPCLLIAFPLSVKGKVLGIFLVEEPEPVPGEGFSASNANRRLRGKRLEIITGISQQAALAIQNDLLQNEMVEQERLEREMQLAREIQSAFMPQSVPDLPGWDLKVRWRPAREVGGDFYDYFELPGNRLGLVISDVADKGMPAALFMTLVRTLVRATVKEIDSPADVLERANDIIVPDAPGGMFVTIFYAVLDLDTGELEFANAGHNLPVVMRGQSCQLELLRRGGMALGVEEGNRIQGWKTRLEPGDYLILYTDGVTEAFSPQGEAFGEPRLYQTIESAIACQGQSDVSALAAQGVLEKIDQAVVEFIADGLPSDDLTLLVLRRQE